MLNDKLGVINSALLRTGNRPLSFEADGSPEWLVGSDAYETSVSYLVAEHNWGFAETFATLQRIGPSDDDRYTDAYAKPDGCLHLSSVTVSSVPIDFDIVDNKILCSAPTPPQAKFVRQPTPDQWPAGFVEVLRQFVMGHIYRGLNEEADKADAAEMKGRAILGEVRARVDAETPARARLVSRLAGARSRRRGG